MNRKRRLPWIIQIPLILVTVLLLVGMTAPVIANDKLDTTQLVDKARLAFQSFMADENMGAFRDLVKKARGVFIAPALLKGAFIFGASGGSGVFLARGEKATQWGGPAFYTMGGASFGLQIGGEASEVVLLAMTQRGVDAFLTSNFKLGANAGVAAGPVGIGVSAETANLSVDILSFSRSKGLYGGVSLDGAVVATRGAWNDAYYGKVVTPSDILIRRSVKNSQAAGLVEAVVKAAGGK